MQELLVIRFSSLGDLCLLASALARLAATSGDARPRITLVTKPAFAPLMESAAGVDRVVPLPGSDLRSLRRLAESLRKEHWDRIIDAHDTLRSRALLGLMGRRPHARLDKDTVARLAFLKFGRRSPRLEITMSERFDRLLSAAGTAADGRPPRPASGDDPWRAHPVHAFGAGQARNELILGLAPGAQWDTKQWPEERFAEFLTLFRGRSPAPVRVFLGPREERWYPGSALERAAAGHERIEVYRRCPLPEIATLIAGCSTLVTNDSGLLHVAEAAGTPVLAFFGPTVREFGFFPRLPASRVLEVDLECRPCSRHGKRPCHRGDLACLRRITTAQALDALLDFRDWSGLRRASDGPHGRTEES